ncbi:hypothetical protein [Vreelandella piezotolerans]|uniref:LAGLIDADG endonuclease n=1 Tax=Vreelandella piezotolerans TaxID=2609667 RepID=A0ABQ6XDM5_9GAMM|nr:hypothetical protein [Halomonas piezotolerans]KAE8440070.1 hypothetical protein F1978_02165 [Halomonas piezotolerans]QJA23607.1 hypothetical protein GYM47_05520 [Halomonas piezotolerans]
MAVLIGTKHKEFKGLKGMSGRDFVFYAHLLSSSFKIFNAVTSTPGACMQEVLSYLSRYTGSDRSEQINWLNSQRNLSLLPDEHFEWIKIDERVCCWAWGWLMTSHLSSPVFNNDGSMSYPPTTEFQNSLKTFPTNTRERFNSIVYFFDTRSVNLEEKKQDIEKMKATWMSVLDSPHPLKFIDPSNELQCAWAWEYLQKHGASMSIFSPTNNKEKYLSAVASMDLAGVHRDTKRIFLMNMKKACDQKKYREKLKGKKPLNTFINEDSKQRLNWLAKQRGQNINKTLEWLIDKEYDSHV